MTTAIAVAFCALLALLAPFQLLLIVGMPFGRFAWGGQAAVLPARLRIGSAVSIAVYAVFALVALDCAGLIVLFSSPMVAVVAMWVIAAYLLLSVLPNVASKSKYEKRAMVPVSLALAALAFLIAVS
jgi:hypothetical protein